MNTTRLCPPNFPHVLPPAPASATALAPMQRALAWCLRGGALLALTVAVHAASPYGKLPPNATPGDKLFAEYFRAETFSVANRTLADVTSLADWNARKDKLRGQLFEMLSLAPLPPKTDLHATTTGTVEHPEFTVEKVHFQSLPGFYVTANLYVPKKLDRPAPAILYVCGHSLVKTNDVSYGSKVGYQHHGAWFARNGYVALIIDTVQLGELEGIHHGTYNKGMWWWNSRGYSSAGTEAWNCIRALDYLQTRKEVDPERIGVTGRSGGGAYSWWIAALDERIKAACPVAGITDLQNHVIDGTVEGHCDCMFMVNTYRWDYAQVAALVAPRPLLICNTDKDPIFPLEGVVRLHEKVRRIYELNNAGGNLGLLITEGPHKDTQELQVPVLRWFNRFLKKEEAPVENHAVKLFTGQQLKVFEKLPEDERTSHIYETFVPTAKTPEVPKDAPAWSMQRNEWMVALKERVFAGWPREAAPLDLRPVFTRERDGVQFTAFEFQSQNAVPLRLYVASPVGLNRAEQVVVNVLDDRDWANWLGTMVGGFAGEMRDELAAVEPGVQLTATPETAKIYADWQAFVKAGRTVHVYFAPRGVGLTALSNNSKHLVQTRRRFMLLGQTLDSMRVWDIRRALQATRTLPETTGAPVLLRGSRYMAANTLYASLFGPDVTALELRDLPASHQDGPDYLNVLRFLDLPQAVALATERSTITLRQPTTIGLEYPLAIAAKEWWGKERLKVVVKN